MSVLQCSFVAEGTAASFPTSGSLVQQSGIGISRVKRGRGIKKAPRRALVCKLFVQTEGVDLRALDLHGLEAARADVHLAAGAVLVDHVDALDVRLELAVGDTMGVADVMAGRRMLAADFADLRHVRTLLGRLVGDAA